jgi:hypothetical protein
MDISRFDFELDEIVGLIPRLTALAQMIELEPRLHNADEGEKAPIPVAASRPSGSRVIYRAAIKP